MDRFLVIDLQDMVVINTQKVDFPDINEGWSEKYDEPTDFEKGVYESVGELLDARRKVYGSGIKMKRMPCDCEHTLENEGVWVRGENGFICDNCGKEYDKDGNNMAYKPDTWVMTSHKDETYAYDEQGKMTDCAMGSSETHYEIYKTDKDGLRCNANYPLYEANNICRAKMLLDNCKIADEKGYDWHDLCPHCANNLARELGVSEKADRVMYAESGGFGDVEYGNVIEYYCPCCGSTIPMSMGEELDSKYYG